MDDALALLRLQLEWGADEALELNPVDRLQPIKRQPDRRPSAMPGPAKGTPAERALASAAQASTLDELRTALSNFDGCSLRETASNLVFAEGDPDSAVLIVGEPPGREEDRSGHPFAGPEGQLLDQMLGSVGLSRTDLMLTPLLPWRPPGGRPPSPAEIAICQPFLHQLMALLRPQRLVLFGGTAARAVLPQTQYRRRGSRTWADIKIPGIEGPIPALALPALGEMLKNPPLRRDAWAGVRLLRRALEAAQTQT